MIAIPRYLHASVWPLPAACLAIGLGACSRTQGSARAEPTAVASRVPSTNSAPSSAVAATAPTP